jgi:DNA primase
MNKEFLESLGLQVFKVSGNDIIARCPSGRHEDRNPSWRLRYKGRNRGLHYCHSCRWGGSLTGLMMWQLKISHDEAVSVLQQRNWQDVAPLVSSLQVSIEQTPTESFKAPVGVEFEPLRVWPQSLKNYVIQRGFNSTTVERWRLGFASVGRCWGRVVIPIRDAQSRLCSYMARLVLGSGQRYLYPSANEHPDNTVSFGECHWPRQEFRDCVAVAEGAFNAMSLDAALYGMPVMALGGSRLTPHIVARLSTFRTIYIVTDDDNAGWGVRSAIHANLSNPHMVLKDIVFDGKDANDCSVNEIREAFQCSN